MRLTGRVIVTVYDVPQIDEELPAFSGRLAELKRRAVHVQRGWTVGQVLEAGGATRYNTFSLVTDDVEEDVRRGLDRGGIVAVHNLLGLDGRGVAYYELEDPVLWHHFLRAVDAGLYQGDSQRIVVYPEGVAGGPSPDGLWAAILWLFENHGVIADAAEEIAKVGAGVGTVVAGRRWVTGKRKKHIAQQWRKQGLTGPRIREYLHRLPQWDPDRLAQQTQLTSLEACLALTNAGYERCEDGLWRLGHSPEAMNSQNMLEQIEGQALQNMDDGWTDDFTLPDDDAT